MKKPILSACILLSVYLNAEVARSVDKDCDELIASIKKEYAEPKKGEWKTCNGKLTPSREIGYEEYFKSSHPGAYGINGVLVVGENPAINNNISLGKEPIGICIQKKTKRKWYIFWLTEASQKPGQIALPGCT